MNYLEAYYSHYNEEGRLLSQHGQVEYRTTMKYIGECLADIADPAVLEVGPAPADTALPWPNRGCRLPQWN